MTELGAGIALDEDFDLIIDSTGDIDETRGSAELQKDVAFNLVLELQDILGRPVTKEVLALTKSVTNDVLVEDPRVNNVVSIEVRKVDENSDELEIITSVNADTGQQELVFSIGE